MGIRWWQICGSLIQFLFTRLGVQKQKTYVHNQNIFIWVVPVILLPLYQAKVKTQVGNNRVE